LYGKTWTITDNGQKNSSEISDEIKLNLLYQWKKIKNINLKKKWWAPLPFVELGEQTEFTSDVQLQNGNKIRYRMFSSILGAGIEPWNNRFFIKLGAGLKAEAGANGFDTSDTFYFGWNLLNGKIVKLSNITLKAESRLDSYFQKNRNNYNFSYEVKLSSKLYFLLSEQLYFNISQETYSYKSGDLPWSTSFNLVFGISYSINGRIPLL